MKLKTNNNQTIWFTSDTHYNHRNIVSGVSDWENTDRCRQFPTLEAHNEWLVNEINSKVKENDILFHLGDWSFGGIEQITIFREAINCKNVHLVLGNHDHHIKTKLHLQDLFSSVSRILDVIIDKKWKIVMCHFPMRVWEDSHKASIMLFGHTHGTIDKPKDFENPAWISGDFYTHNARTMDVGIDSHPNKTLFSWGEIKSIMIKKPILLGVDHHNEKTT